MTPYRRETLVQVLIHHQATATSGCHCGWAKLGGSHAQHVANEYEAAVNDQRLRGILAEAFDAGAEQERIRIGSGAGAASRLLPRDDVLDALIGKAAAR